MITINNDDSLLTLNYTDVNKQDIVLNKEITIKAGELLEIDTGLTITCTSADMAFIIEALLPEYKTTLLSETFSSASESSTVKFTFLNYGSSDIKISKDEVIAKLYCTTTNPEYFATSYHEVYRTDKLILLATEELDINKVTSEYNIKTSTNKLIIEIPTKNA